ncbi:TonB-dependent receptor [Ferruginibacter paludis]|uniref:SusC/RagA family TonB-linked outer membrane protein n=1 Tax=Ferruginibacter paludis TaxID=1310417 RepID=UPI0025B53713|nr:TonB-dependent receptor [Ferruginibacter paludis]MDN3654009.1 TonB-dependent receptor [Ferruginibacter paludis]
MMKIKLIAWVLLPLILSATQHSGYAQTTSSAAQTQGNETMSLTSALKKVSDVFNTQFVYEKSLLEGKTMVYKGEATKDKPIEEVLKSILYPNGFIFLYVKENYYSIVAQKQFIENGSSPGGVATNQQSVTTKAVYTYTAAVKNTVNDKIIKGKVINSTGNPIEKVSVNLKGSNAGTTTDVNGEYTINVPDNGTLVFSYIGYATQEIAISGKSIVNVRLSEELKLLNEVVVATGYSNQRKKDITGSVAVVDMNALKSIPTGSAEQALQGQAAGVTVISSGAPGGRNDIFIRGVTSFGNSQPLIIVDGVQGSLTDLNINDIASMQVLKDAGAASIYGVRGSNGVIIITTKKGKSGQPTLSLDSYYGNQSPAKGNVFNLLNSQDYATLFKQVNPGTILFANGLPDYTYAGPSNAGTAMEGDPAVNPVNYNFDASNPENDYLIQRINKSGTDWFHEIFKPAPMQSHTITGSGGTDKSNYLFSLGYLDQKGTLINTYLKRYSARVNTELKINKNIKIGENVYLFYKQNPGFSNQQEGNAVSLAFRTLPIIPVYDIKGNYGGTWLGPDLGTVENAVAVQQRTANNKNNSWDVIGNVYAEVSFLKHFTARSSFGGTVDHQSSHNFTFNAYNDKQGHTSQNSYNENAFFNSSYTWTNAINYINTFGKHSIKLLAGSEAVKNYGEALGGSSNGFFSTNPNYLFLNNGTSNVTNYSNSYVNSLFSVFSHLDYSFKDKYLLGATVRRDGSSVFGADKRYGIFPSFSLGWRVSNEGFMKNVTFINDLKVRGSYGILGAQANVSASNAFTLFSSGFGTSYYDITGSGSTRQGFFQSRNGNPNTKWEQDVISNVGIDATILNSKVNISVEWYKKSVNGLLFPQPLPATTGNADPPTINVGDIQNKGWDFSANYHGTITNDFKFNVGLNVTTYKNLVVKIPDPGYFDVSSSRIGNLVRNQVGHPVGSFYGYEVVGLFQDASDVAKSPTQTDAAPGRFRYKDLNGDGQITPEDRTFFGNPNPDFTYGLNLNVTYKGFDLSTIFYGSQGNDAINFVRYYTDFFGTSEGKGKSNVLKNAWSPQNLNSKTPIAEYASTFSTNGVFNSYYKENGSFLKLRSLILGYSINPVILKRYNISKFRLYLQAANLFTITKYTGLDPELTGSLGGNQASSAFGVDYGNYPNNQKNFLLGVNVTF